MAQPQPQYNSNPDPLTRAEIAGYLLHYRAGFLRALESLADPAADPIAAWRDGTMLYYIHAESVTRFLLSQLGYPVQKDQMYGGYTSGNTP